MDSKGSMEIQKEATKLLKVPTIVPYMLMIAQSSRRSMMTHYSQKEKAVTTTAIFKMKM